MKATNVATSVASSTNVAHRNNVGIHVAHKCCLTYNCRIWIPQNLWLLLVRSGALCSFYTLEPKCFRQRAVSKLLIVPAVSCAGFPNASGTTIRDPLKAHPLSIAREYFILLKRRSSDSLLSCFGEKPSRIYRLSFEKAGSLLLHFS